MRPAALLLRGQVMHDRLRPVRNRFVYPVFCVRLDLGRLEQAGNAWFGVDRRRPLSVRTRDYGPRDGGNLEAWMRAQLAAAGIAADGEIWLQTFPRVFGYAFNPVNFWYCLDRDGALRAVLAEVNNTFGAHHSYLLAAPDGAPVTQDSRLECVKTLHVSPFCEVRGGYRFRFRDTAHTGMVGIDYDDGAGLLLRTAIGGRLAPLTARTALGALLAQPLMTVGVVARIHWQALKLWWRRVPVFSNPGRGAG